MSLYKHFVWGTLCTLSLPGLVIAAPENNSSWGVWFNQQISQHAEIVAAKETMNAALSLSESSAQPLYNPELETGYEREGSTNNYSVGISQTFDWSDKLAMRQQQGSYSKIEALQNFESILREKYAEALVALVSWQGAKQLAELAKSQEEQLNTLLELIQSRQQAGDLSQIDAELAFLGLSQRLNDTAEAQAELIKVEVQVRELLPAWTATSMQVPANFWQVDVRQFDPLVFSPAWLDTNPLVLSAQAEWDGVKQEAALAKKEQKADPTFGISAGQADSEFTLGLSFSIPLNVRNDFSAQAQAASQQVLAAEARYRDVRRKQRLAIEVSQSVLNEYAFVYKRLNNLMQGRGERSESLLAAQWQSGDMSTSEYLQALAQRIEGLSAGIELRMRYQIGLIDWLLQTGKINQAVLQTTK